MSEVRSLESLDGDEDKASRQSWVKRPFDATFLVECYATLHPALSVRPSVRQSVGPSHFTFFGVIGGFGLIAPAQIFH